MKYKKKLKLKVMLTSVPQAAHWGYNKGITVNIVRKEHQHSVAEIPEKQQG